MKAKLQNDSTTVSLSRRNALKTLAVGSFIAAAPTFAANTRQNACLSSYDKTIPFEGLHQAGVLTPEQKNASFIAFNVTVESLDKLQKLFEILTKRIAYLTQVQTAPKTPNDRMPPAESGILGTHIQPDALTVTVSLGQSLFDTIWVR